MSSLWQWRSGSTSTGLPFAGPLACVLFAMTSPVTVDGERPRPRAIALALQPVSSPLCF